LRHKFRWARSIAGSAGRLARRALRRTTVMSKTHHWRARRGVGYCRTGYSRVGNSVSTSLCYRLQPLSLLCPGAASSFSNTPRTDAARGGMSPAAPSDGSPSAWTGEALATRAPDRSTMSSSACSTSRTVGASSTYRGC
jgi:hypothetical protein